MEPEGHPAEPPDLHARTQHCAVESGHIWISVCVAVGIGILLLGVHLCQRTEFITALERIANSGSRMEEEQLARATAADVPGDEEAFMRAIRDADSNSRWYAESVVRYVPVDQSERIGQLLLQLVLDASTSAELRRVGAACLVAMEGGVAKYLYVALADGDAGAKTAVLKVIAGRALSEYGRETSWPDDLTERCVAALADPDAEVRIAACEILSAPAPQLRQSLPGILAAIRDSNYRVRALVAQILASIGPDVLPYLLEDSRKEPPPQERHCIVRVVRMLGSRAVPALRGWLRSEDDGLQLAALTCSQVLEGEAKPLLPDISDLVQRGSERVKIDALGCLQTLGRVAAPALPTIEAALQDPSEKVQWYADAARREIKRQLREGR